MAKVVFNEFQPPPSPAQKAVVEMHTSGAVRVAVKRRVNRSPDAGNRRQRVAAFWKVWRRGLFWWRRYVQYTGFGPNNLYDFVLNTAPEFPQRNWLFKLAFADGQAAWLAGAAAYDLMASTARESWEAEAVRAGINPTHWSYADEGAITPGKAMFIFCSTVDALESGEPVNPPTAENYGYYSYFLREQQPLDLFDGDFVTGDWRAVLEVVDCDAISGYAYNLNDLSLTYDVMVRSKGIPVAFGRASLFRNDLFPLLGANANKGFSFSTPAKIKNGKQHSITAEIYTTDFFLDNSPQTLTC